MTTLVQALYNAVAATCPIVGVAVGNSADKATWRIDYDPSATPAQQAAAQSAMAAFTFDQAAEDARLAGIDTNIAQATYGSVQPATVQQLKAMSAADLGAWFDANFATNAQLVALLKRLTILIIRRVL